MRIKTKPVMEFQKKWINRSIVFKKLYFACDYQYLFILLRPKRKINEGRRTTGKA